MFRRYKRRSTNIVFVIFRLTLSMIMLAVLAGGLYSAYKHFSGLDPLKIDPKTLITSLVNSKSPQDLITVLTSIKLSQTKQDNQNILGQIQKTLPNQPAQENPVSSRSFMFSFALISDSHSDNLSLRKALAQIKKDYPIVKFIIGLGDYTEVGTEEELKKAKVELDSLGLRYFLTAGDHDLWDSRNRNLAPITNFQKIFGSNFQSFVFGNFKFIILDNSDNYLGLGQNQLDWLNSELQKSSKENIRGTFVFLHEPLFHPSSDHVMGRVENKLKIEARNLIKSFLGEGVKKVFAGDIHFFSEYQDPETTLLMTTIGAVTSQRNTQAPRFAIVYVYDDGSTRIEDVEIK